MTSAAIIRPAADGTKLMLAGASAVQVGAANLRNPCACKEILEELPVLCEKLGIHKLSDVTGGAHS